MPASDTRAIVLDPTPIFARGVASILQDAGFLIECAGEPVQWAAEPGRRVAVVAVSPASGAQEIAELQRAGTDLAIVALVEVASPAAYAEALRAGACSAVAREAPPRELVAVVDAAARGFCLMPTEVMEGLVGWEGPGPFVSPGEVEILRRLAFGDSVADLADHLGYSEREMHRKLRRLYDRMGAANRAQAIVRATQWGLVGPDADQADIDLID